MLKKAIIIVILATNITMCNAGKLGSGLNIAIGATAATCAALGVAVVAKVWSLYNINSDLKNDRRTWNLAKEDLPNLNDISVVSDIGRKTLLFKVLRYSDYHIGNPYYLVDFALVARDHFRLLNSYCALLEGVSARGKIYTSITKKILLSKKINDTLEEVNRCKKRLSTIILVVINSDEYKEQLKLSASRYLEITNN